MVPLALFGSRAFVGLTFFTFLLYGALGGLMLLLPYTLIEAGGYSAVQAGSALLPLPIVIALGSPLMGKLAAADRPALAADASGPLLVAGRLRAGAPDRRRRRDYWTTVLPSILAVSAGMAIAVAPLTTAVLGSVDEHHVGTASGLNSAVSRGGGLIVDRPARRRPVAAGRGADRRAPRRRAWSARRSPCSPSLTAFATLGERSRQTFARNGVKSVPSS